jgi:hypothetical protein
LYSRIVIQLCLKPFIKLSPVFQVKWNLKSNLKCDSIYLSFIVSFEHNHYRKIIPTSPTLTWKILSNVSIFHEYIREYSNSFKLRISSNPLFILCNLVLFQLFNFGIILLLIINVLIRPQWNPVKKKNQK